MKTPKEYKSENLKYIKSVYDKVDRDKFVLTDFGIIEVYYNPDATAGGQIVECVISANIIEEALPLSNDTKKFFGYLDMKSKVFLHDINTEDFREFLDYFIKLEFDAEGRNETTIAVLKSHLEKLKSEGSI